MQDDDRESMSLSQYWYAESQGSRIACVNAAAVTDWAEGTLAEWLQGYSDRIEESGEQYRIRLVDQDVYRVETIDGHVARTFKVNVFVAELT